jgi:hypothetical protein
MIGALAMVRQIDYRQTYDAFDQLNHTTRQNLTAVTFFAFKQREKEFIAQGRTLQARCSASNTSFARQSMPTTRHRIEHA